MIRKIKTVRDVVAWNLCIGCGACASICRRGGGIELVDVPSHGIRPRFTDLDCAGCTDCLAVCPGVCVDANGGIDDELDDVVESRFIGRNHGVYEGYAADPEIRYQGSSGGILSALAAYALEREGMDFVVHTAMDPDQPWKNKTVISRNREQLLACAGSRYCTSSPCEYFDVIEKNDKPCVFVGKPCDVAALARARRLRPELDKKTGLVLSFFCAGTPCSDAVRELAEEMGVETSEIRRVRFRGQGWPGPFRVESVRGGKPRLMAYLTAWKKLARQRPFRCHICPDGMGQLSDITSGDAWNRYTGKGESDGLSHVVVRTGRGRRLLENAVRAGYVELSPAADRDIVKAQGIYLRRAVVFGRLVGMRICGVPTPHFANFRLLYSWLRTNPFVMLKSIFGTLKRMIVRKLWRKGSLYYR